jgi:hypothetical protein
MWKRLWELWKVTKEELSNDYIDNYMKWLPDHILEDTINLLPLFFERNKDKWEWNYLSVNSAFTPDYIERNIDKPWHWEGLCVNRSLTREFITKYYSRLTNGGTYLKIMSNSQFDFRSIRGTIEFGYLSQNTSLTPQFVRENIWGTWNWFQLSCNPAMTSEFIEETLNTKGYSWKRAAISRNPSLTLDFVNRHPSRFHGGLAGNPVITLEFIDNHPEHPWNYKDLSRNPRLTFEYVQTHRDRPWDMYALSRYLPNIAELFEQHPDFPWNWDGVIQNHPNYRWRWDYLSFNPNIMNRF